MQPRNERRAGSGPGDGGRVGSVGRRPGDRRGKPRFEVVGQLWGSLETVQPLRPHDLSRGGALVESGVALPLESIQRFRVAFEGVLANLHARVCHVRPAGRPSGPATYLVGLEFVDVPPGLAEHLERFTEARTP